MVGAEVRGVDARHTDERTMLTVRDALLRYGVVVLHDQDLNPQQQMSFLDRLYPLYRPPEELYTTFTVPGYPYVVIISNIEKEGKPIGLNDAGVLWHHDRCFRPDPDIFASLYGVTIPSRDGKTPGDTYFASGTAAYDALPETEKLRLARFKVLQNYALSVDRMREQGKLRRPDDTESARIDTMEAVHDLVRTHPLTGRKFLYVNESCTKQILGMDEDESRTTIAELASYAIQPEFRYVHSWREGDLLIWDNIANQHRATFDYGDLPRRLHRCSTSGPIGDNPGRIKW
jgi:taurine dioxygenase